MLISAQKKTPSVNRGNLVAELTKMQSIGVSGGFYSIVTKSSDLMVMKYTPFWRMFFRKYLVLRNENTLIPRLTATR